jgi:hypothetical protein
MSQPTLDQHKALHQLLQGQYIDDLTELRRLVRDLPDGQGVQNEIPPTGQPSSLTELDNIERWLYRNGLVGQDLFNALVVSRPRLEHQIRAVQRQFQRIVLFMSAAPKDLDPVQVKEEAADIVSTIRRVFGDQAMGLVARHDVGLSDWREQIELVAPEILHFSGHGSMEGFPVLLDGPDGTAQPPLDPLMRQLRASGIQGAVFNSCFSSRLAEAAVQQAGLRWAVGSSRKLEDETAIAFARGFYGALARGKAPRAAYEAGKDACAWDNLLSDLLVFYPKA